MNNVVFSTGGNWDSTTLFNNGMEVAAAQLFVQIQAGRDAFGEPDSGGIQLGGDLNAIVRLQDNPMDPHPILPGRIEVNFPGHQLIIENGHPLADFFHTRVWYNGRDVTDRLLEAYVDVNGVDDVVQAYVTLFKPHWFTADEIATYTFL